MRIRLTNEYDLSDSAVPISNTDRILSSSLASKKWHLHGKTKRLLLSLGDREISADSTLTCFGVNRGHTFLKGEMRISPLGVYPPLISGNNAHVPYLLIPHTHTCTHIHQLMVCHILGSQHGKRKKIQNASNFMRHIF